MVDPEAHGIERRRLVGIVELDSEIIAVDPDIGVIEHGRQEIVGPRHTRLQDQDPIEALTALPHQRDAKAVPGLGYQALLPNWVTALEDDIHGISRLSPLVIDREAGDSTA